MAMLDGDRTRRGGAEARRKATKTNGFADAKCGVSPTQLAALHFNGHLWED
jgi:hypothetical protein